MNNIRNAFMLVWFCLPLFCCSYPC